MADPSEQTDLVGLEAHPRATSEAEPAPGQTPLDVLGRHQQAGGQPLDDHHEGASVRLAGSQEAEHAGKSTRGSPGQDPAWNRLWAMWPPQKTAMTAPTAREGARDPRLSSRRRDHHHDHTEDHSDDESGQEGHVGVEQAQIADGDADHPGQPDIAEPHAPGDEPPDGEEKAEGDDAGDDRSGQVVPGVVEGRRRPPAEGR